MKNPLGKEVYQRRTEPLKAEEKDPRGYFFRDQTKIVHSLPFRRLKHKTQVFFCPDNDHICTRMEHTIHVATVAATICRGLKKYGWDLEEDLAYAIGLGHDLGHAPFGHAGEEAINKLLDKGKKFHHEVQGYRLVEHIYKLNLTYGVKDGIISHNGETYEQVLIPSDEEKSLDAIDELKTLPTSYEGCIARFSDKIAYLGRDLEDAIRLKCIDEGAVPKEVKEILGDGSGEFDNSTIINNLVLDIIKNSAESSAIRFSDEMFAALLSLRDFNYDRIYKDERIVNYKNYLDNIISCLFNYLIELYRKLGNNYEEYTKFGELAISFSRVLGKTADYYKTSQADPKTIVIDYLSGMTDNFALKSMEEISIPQPLKFT